MKKNIVGIISGIIITVLGGAILYYLGLKKPDVRYTLSEEIPVAFSDGQNTENVQQLELKNIGSEVADRIVVKISGEITNYRIIKYTSSDNVDAFIDQELAEFVYPSLPPDAGFKIVFTSFESINYSDISISHDTGKAQEALSKSGIGFWAWAFYLLIVGGYFIGVFKTSRDIALMGWESKVKYGMPVDDALKIDQPWYVSYEKWKKLYLDAFKYRIERETVYDGKIVNSASYILLQQEKPENLSDAVWVEINEFAIKQLEHHLSKSIISYSRISILRVISSERPLGFPEEDWMTILDDASKNLVNRYKNNLYFKKDILAFFEEKKPEYVSNSAWQEICRYAESSLQGEYERRAYSVQSLMNVLQEEKAEMIPDRLWESIQESARKSLFDGLMHKVILDNLSEKQLQNEEGFNYLNDQQKNSLLEKASRIRKYISLNEALTTLLRDENTLEKRPDLLSDLEWSKIKEFEEKIVQLKDIKYQKKELSGKMLFFSEEREIFNVEKKTVDNLKSKVIKQLDFIARLFDNPAIINRIEAYDDTFSPGNWDVLHKVAVLLEKESTKEKNK